MDTLDWVLLVAVVAVPLALAYWMIRVRKKQPDPKGGQPFEGPVRFPGDSW